MKYVAFLNFFMNSKNLFQKIDENETIEEFFKIYKKDLKTFIEMNDFDKVSSEDNL